MTKPTQAELERWLQDNAFRYMALYDQQADDARGASAFRSDLHLILRCVAEPRLSSRPIAAVSRMVTRAGHAIAPSLPPKQARKAGMSMLKECRFLSKVFQLEVRQEWIDRMRSKIEEYDHACLGASFIERVYELSKPGGVTDRIEKFERGELPKIVVEADLALTHPGQMTRIDALRQAAHEIAERARRLFGYLPRQWDPQVSDRTLQDRHAKILEPYLEKKYWDREGGTSMPPKISVYALKNRPGRPRKI